MCDMGHDHGREGFGYLVDTPEIRALIAEVQRVTGAIRSDEERVTALRPAFAALLAADGWLPEECARPDEKSRMGGGIAQYALYRAEDGSLCLFSLVVPAGAATPVHDHLAWGLVGIYRGRQDETVYRRLDDGSEPGQARLEVTKRQTLETGEFYTLLPPADDIHYVQTVSETASIPLNPSARQRHRLHLAASLRPRVRCGHPVPVRLRERAVSTRRSSTLASPAGHLARFL